MYDTGNLTNATDIYEITLAVNQASNGYIGIFILFSLYIIMFIMFKRYEDDTKVTFLSTTAIMSVVSIMMWGVGLLSTKILSVPIVMLVGSLFIFLATKEP